MTQPLLIGFLGKNSVDPNKGYRCASYVIEGETYTTPYFGYALSRYLRPSKMLLLGTSGSMWDVLIEAHAEDGQQEEARLRLMEMAQKGSVTAEVLREFAPLIEKHFGCPVEMQIIPYARDTDEQLGILTTIAAAVPPKQNVVLDVTHGFRHLPMLGLLAAHYLERVKQVKVDRLYYGALDMTEQGITPVLDLSGLLRTMDWIRAFAAYDASGNYTAFSDLLLEEGWNKAECETLREAAFFERTTNIVKAKERLSGIKSALERRNSAFLRLFGDELQKRLSWWKSPQRAEWEISLAQAYYDKGDYLRACIFTQEACLSASMPPNQQGVFSDQREDVRKSMQKADVRFKRLCDIRNAMAHGVKGRRQEFAKALQSEQNLKSTLGDLIKNWSTLGKLPE